MAGKFFNCSRIVTMTFVLTVVLYQTEAALKTIFIDDICQSQNIATIKLKDMHAGILMANSHFEPLDCVVTLEPVPGFSVVLSIYKYELETEDSLTIEDADHHKFSLSGWRIFPNEKKSVISEGRITIHFVRSNYSVWYPPTKFQFTFTQVGSAPCYINEFECNNEKCIPQNLVCDKHNHCGDNSDQITCAPNEEVKQIQPTRELHYAADKRGFIWIITISVCGFILFVVTIVFFVAVVRNARKKKASASSVNPEAQVSNTGTQSSPAAVLRDPQPLSVSNLQSSVNVEMQPNQQQRPTIFNQIRRSLRNYKSRNAEGPQQEQSKSELYQVPSMYPNLDQIPTAPVLEGEDNPNFKPEE